MSAPDKIAVDLAPPARAPVMVQDPMPPMERMGYPDTTRHLGEIQVEVGRAAEHLRAAWDVACTEEMLCHPQVQKMFGDFLRFAVTFRPEVTNGSLRDDTMESEND